MNDCTYSFFFCYFIITKYYILLVIFNFFYVFFKIIRWLAECATGKYKQ